MRLQTGIDRGRQVEVPIEWVNAFLPATRCNRCYDAKMTMEKTSDAMIRICETIIREGGSSADVLSASEETLRRHASTYAHAAATRYRRDPPDDIDDFAQNIFGTPRNVRRYLAFYARKMKR